MDKNELMVGDWVTIFKFRENGSNRYVKVNAVGAECILAPGMFQNESGCNPYDFKQLAPILLTEDILQANGFRYFSSATPYYYEENRDVTILKNQGYEGYATHILGKRINIRYVHELQHTLRLCGLKDFADNFVIHI